MDFSIDTIDWYTLTSLAKLAAVGLVSGVFSAFLATRDHRFKKWWELRVVAYQSLIEAISDLSYVYNSKYAAEIQSRQLSADREEELRRITKDAQARVRKTGDSGKFLLSSEVIEALSELARYEAEDYPTYFEYLDSCQWATAQCKTQIVELSLKDLRLTRFIF